MKHCVRYPDDKFLAVRPCLVAICFGNRPAAKLLGTLLYRYNLRVENKDDAENINAIKLAKGQKPDQDTTYRIFRTQLQLVDDMCGEMTEKTLHNVAVPMLQLLGFLDIEEHVASNCYIVDINLVQQALDLYRSTGGQLEKFLIDHMQLEKFLISTKELEKFLMNKKNFQLGLEKVLIANRKSSNCKRGRKTASQAASKRVFRKPQNTEESLKNPNKEGGPGDRETPSLPAFPENENEDNTNENDDHRTTGTDVERGASDAALPEHHDAPSDPTGRTAEQQPPTIVRTQEMSETGGMTIDDITHDTPLCWQAFYAIAMRYLPAHKISQREAQMLVEKQQPFAAVLPAIECYRQFVSILTFMIFSDAPSNWYRTDDKQKTLTLRCAATYYADYSRKCQSAEWIPPADKVPAWFADDGGPLPSPDGEYVVGMTKPEANELADRIEAEYPLLPVPVQLGHLPNDRYTVGINLGLGNDAWLDFGNETEWLAWLTEEPDRLWRYRAAAVRTRKLELVV